jgi:hypothetical protein
MLIRRFSALGRSLVGIWLGLWTISGIATFISGVLILDLQLYGYFYLDFWADLTPAGVMKGFGMGLPTAHWEPAQKAINCVLFLPLSAVFIWCGFHIAAMAWIARKNLEKKVAEARVVIPATAERFAALGISSLEVRPEE